MLTFFACLALLIIGYMVYGKFVDTVFAPTDKETPALELTNGVDYVPLPTAKVFLIQLLNIAGLGPIFGAIAGALWGPVVFLWIVFGTIFAGAVHDYLSGMISLRNNGASISEVVGKYLGPQMKSVMRVFSVVLLVLVGTVFMTGPAMLLVKLTGMKLIVWLGVIVIYYFLATLLPIDQVIGRIYPLFGICLIIMAVGVGGGIVLEGYQIPELTLTNMHPAGLPIWPLMFITVACGAISGFHSTQSPMMARCLMNEKHGRMVFYGAMVSEGIIALIWAAAGVAFYNSTGGLAAALKAGGPGGVVYDVCFGLLGGVGGILAMIGVIACPITSGDTAFRSARLTLADWFKLDQAKSASRLYLAVPLLGVGTILSQMNFSIIWRYFAWTNQTLAMIVLFAGAVYLYRECANKAYCWLAAIPATFMSVVVSTYILQAPEGLKLPVSISYPAGLVFGAFCFFLFVKNTFMSRKEEESSQVNA
ncbi:MAG: carbon starvation protein A [Acidaminococcaceae bacterium]